MKVLYYDCLSGISAEMNLGAMIELGVDPEYLLGELNLLQLAGDYQIRIHREKHQGVTGTRVQITGGNRDKFSHPHAFKLCDILKIVSGSKLGDKVKSRSCKMFELLAEAEALVHGLNKEEVHFPEGGALEAIIGIVGAAVCWEYLKVDKIVASPVELGGGFVPSQYGLLPVPAPAVLTLLRGVPVSMGGVWTETTTPTGAAILAANVDAFATSPDFTIERIGDGVGKRDTEISYVLRVILGNLMNEEATIQYMVETNIDNMNPEFFEFIEERLFSAGALDVFKTLIIMKNGRPATQLSVLTAPQNIPAVEKIILRETTANGLRKYALDKVMLDREIIVLNTPYGPVRVKVSYLGGKRITAKPEYEDCKRIAKESNLTLQEVYKVVCRILGE